MAQLRILAVTPPEIIAPAGLWFEAVDVAGFALSGQGEGIAGFDPEFHEITYRWQVLDSPLAAFDAPGNMIPDWNDPNRAYGKKVAFFFPRPGRYRVGVVAEDRHGNRAGAEVAFEVADPDQVYAGERTIAVSFDPGETWADVPGGSRRAANPAELEHEIRSSKEPARLRFKRGQVFGGFSFQLAGRQLGQIDAWGGGAAPVLKARTQPLFVLHRRARITALTLADLAFQGDWDSTTETGYSTVSPFLWSKSPTPAHYAVWNCRFDGFDHLDAEVQELPSTVLFGNSTVTNWRNFGFLFRSHNARFALVGMCIAQHEEALHGGPKSGALSNTHGPVRIPDCANVYIGTSDFFSRTGWSGVAEQLADQPCLRLNTSGARGSFFNLDRIVCEGGLHQINLEGANSRIEENPGNYVIDKALFIGGAKTIGPFVAVDFGGLTLRNAIGILPDAPRHHPNRWQGALRTNMDNPAEGNARTPLSVYSSSFLNLLEGGNDTGKEWLLHRGAKAFDNATYENNVLSDPPRGRVGLDLEGVMPGIRPRFRGIRYNFRNQHGTLEAHVAPGQAFLVPYAEITEDTAATRGTRPTTEAYWLETEATDRWHMLAVRGLRQTQYAAKGDFEVIFGAEGALIVNRGRKTWKAGARYELRLDRASRLSASDARYATPEHLPLPVPAPGMRAYRSANAGLLARDDFFGHPRGASPSQGAVEPE